MVRSSIFDNPNIGDAPLVPRTALQGNVRNVGVGDRRTLCIFEGVSGGCGVTRVLREGWQEEIGDRQRREVIAPVDLVHQEKGLAPHTMATIAWSLIAEADKLKYAAGKKCFREFTAAYLVFLTKYYAGGGIDIREIADVPETSADRRRDAVFKFAFRFGTMGIADAFDLAEVFFGERTQQLADQVTEYFTKFLDQQADSAISSHFEKRLRSLLRSGSYNAVKALGADAATTTTMLCEQMFEENLELFLTGLRRVRPGLGVMVLTDHIDICVPPGPQEIARTEQLRWVHWEAENRRASESAKSVELVIKALSDATPDGARFRASFGLRGDKLPLAAAIRSHGPKTYAVDDVDVQSVRRMLGNPPKGTEQIAGRVLAWLEDESLLSAEGKLSPTLLAEVWRRHVGEI